MKGEVSFDTEVFPNGQNHIEGCYRLNQTDWKIFNFTHWRDGKLWADEPSIIKDAIWRSGVSGIDAVYPVTTALNKHFVINELARILQVKEWHEVHGPDSLQLK